MAWRMMAVRDQRVEFVIRAQRGQEKLSRLCIEFGISRPTAYVWLQRYREQGVAGIEERSRRPQHSPRQTAAPLEQRIAQLRRERPDWGARKLQLLLQKEGIVLPVITVHRVLLRHGLVRPDDRGSPAWQRFERAAPNQLWQMDFKSPKGCQQPVGPLSVIDDHSRFVVALEKTGSTRTEAVRERLERAFLNYGLREAMLMDHGTPWWNAQAPSGWTKLPGRKDMAKLQFGDSFCQIEGTYVPVADMSLAGRDRVYFTHHVILWKDPQVEVTTMPLSGGWKRMFAGLPLIMTEAHGPGHIAFSRDAPGELISLPLQPGEYIDVREHLFMVATNNVTYDWFSTNVWFTTGTGDDRETHYPVGMFMDRFSAPQAPGLLILHAAGNVLVRTLSPGQVILVRPAALVFKDPSVNMQLHFEHPGSGYYSGWGSWSNRYLWLRLYGPGRVAIQSVFDRLGGESLNIQNWSSATERRW